MAKAIRVESDSRFKLLDVSIRIIREFGFPTLITLLVLGALGGIGYAAVIGLKSIWTDALLPVSKKHIEFVDSQIAISERNTKTAEKTSEALSQLTELTAENNEALRSLNSNQTTIRENGDKSRQTMTELLDEMRTLNAQVKKKPGGME